MKTRNTKYERSVRQKVLNRLQQREPNNGCCGSSAHQPSETSINEQIKLALAQSYNQKPVRDLFQLDALITREPVAGITHSSSGTTDEDGDCINCQRKYELRITGNDTVRIQVPVGVTRVEAARVLRKAAEWIESRHAVLDPKVWDGLGGNRTIILNRCVGDGND